MRTLVIVGMTSLCGTCMGQVFIGLGVVPGANASTANAISSDGTTIIGTSQQFGGAAWRWTIGSGRVDLGPAPTGFGIEQASDVSGDGSVIVGGMNDGVSISTAWRWTQGTGIQRVAGVGAGAFGPFVSSDGTTIVGRAEGTPLTAVRWTQGTGVQTLNPVTGLPFSNGSARLATAVSADGSVIVGSGTGIFTTNPQPQSAFLPFRWTQNTGSVGILNGGQFWLPETGPVATDVSADGSVIVGAAGLGSFIWSAQGGFQLLTSDVPPPGQSTPHISGDGTTVVYKWHFWTQSGGLMPLTQALSNAGCNFAGWNNLLVTDVSFNGRTLCGYGTNPTGQTEAWYATIPAPSGLVIGALAACSAARRRQ